MVIVKVLLALAAIYGWFLTQLDVNHAFLYSDLHEEFYMCLHPSFHREGESLLTNTVCKLHVFLRA